MPEPRQFVVVPCPHRLMSGEKCPGHLVEVVIRDGIVLSPPMVAKVGFLYPNASDA